MSDPYIGQILFAGFSFAPRGYAGCDGQLLALAQNQALYSLLGTTYGGDGRTTFALPDLRGRSIFGATASVDTAWSASTPIGLKTGSELVTLTLSQLPSHTHPVGVSTTTGTNADPTDAVFAAAGAGVNIYAAPASMIPLGGSPTTVAGGGQPHSNMQPYLVVEMAIALQGIYPSRS